MQLGCTYCSSLGPLSQACMTALHRVKHMLGVMRILLDLRALAHRLSGPLCRFGGGFRPVGEAASVLRARVDYEDRLLRRLAFYESHQVRCVHRMTATAAQHRSRRHSQPRSLHMKAVRLGPQRNPTCQKRGRWSSHERPARTACRQNCCHWGQGGVL